MKYAIISDIHSNLEALEEVLREIDEGGVERILCLGDIVGYNANPNECIELVRERDVACIT
ncbi:metallophosphoesterase family protein [Candidatus Hakubella thermalkaliphila]|uniref:metallophosphoesterase family protein n=1 Tax=Candidatus Hakubella thermalkaliphila TaxID=2754717 RepID=UPI0015936566|nr:metallophosphoesterase family protein [Candidatus Hakubella thermalkaliphila]GFP41057.1 protein phosphatase [Candidatus Hakubella thermalkaliphila]